jgi:hypothetical protein
VWVSRLYRFSAGFLYKLAISLLLYEKAELLPVASKKEELGHATAWGLGEKLQFEI